MTERSQFTGFQGTPIPIAPYQASGDLLFLSGQLPLRDGKVVGDIRVQTDQVLDNIAAVLREVGLSLDNVLKATVWLTDAADFAAFNDVYARRLGSPFPARSCVVSQLVVPGALVEIEVVACRSGGRSAR